jgi:hypothetical protein
MTTEAGVEGFAPIVGQTAGNPEALKYGKMWEIPNYRIVAPGEDLAPIFLQQAKPKPGATVIDFGCGTGRGSLYLAMFGKLNVTMVDFVNNSLDPDIKEMLKTQSQSLRFVKKDLEQPLRMAAEYGYCTDVMEHIPEEKVDIVLDHIIGAAQHVFFSISTGEDRCGKLIGEELHVTVKPFEWWMEKFTKRKCLVHWTKNLDDKNALFYISGWMDGQDLVAAGTLNESVENIRANVKANCAMGFDQVRPYEVNDMEVMILGGGWSLNGQLEEIKKKREEGVKLVTLNGTYNWAIEHGLNPSCQIMVDSRPFNARFTKPVHDTCRYLIASQCHPSVLEGLPQDRTLLWHTMMSDIVDIVKETYPQHWPVPSCTTVMVTSIPLLRMLGFKKFHLYGCDSCIAPDKVTHHSYSQPENDDAPIVPVMVTGGRVFWCQPWMVAQAQQFQEMLKLMKDEVEIAVYGDGLIAHMMEVAAQMADEETIQLI